MGKALTDVVRDGARPSAVPLALAVTLGALLVASSSRYVQGGDGPEFALIFAKGGVPHPPGFPAYVAWLRAMSAILGAIGLPHAPAHAAAVATALLAVPASIFFYAAARAWGAARVPAMLATVAALTWDRAFIEFTQPEVWAMVATVAILILWAAAPASPAEPFGPPRGARRVLALGVLGGLGVATHSTLVFLAPVGLFGAVTGLREIERGRSRVRAAVGGLLGFVAGLSPYYLLLAIARHPEGRWVWNDPSTLERLWLHALRDDYGILALSPFPGESHGAENVAAWLRASVSDGVGAAAVLAVVFVAWSLATSGARSARLLITHPHRNAWLALGASWLLTGPLFFCMFNTNPAGMGAASVSHCYLLPGLPLFLAVAVAASPVWARAPRALAVVTTLLVCANGLAGHRAAALHNTSVIEDYLVDTAGALPPRAVVFVWGDTRTFGFMFLSKGMGVRPDVDFVSLALLQRDFYRVRVEEALGRPFHVSRKSGLFDLVEMIQALNASGRPVLFTTDDPFFYHVAEQLPTYPLGTSLRVLARGEMAPPARDLETENDRLFAAFRSQPHGAHVQPDTWAADLYRAYSRTWLMLADRFDTENDPAGSTRAEARGHAWELPK